MTTYDFRRDGKVRRITKAQYDYMLNVLPPIYATGCFAMGEPVDHTEAGVTYHWAAYRGPGRFVTFYGTRAQAEQAFALPLQPYEAKAEAKAEADAIKVCETCGDLRARCTGDEATYGEELP